MLTDKESSRAKTARDDLDELMTLRSTAFQPATHLPGAPCTLDRHGYVKLLLRPKASLRGLGTTAT